MFIGSFITQRHLFFRFWLVFFFLWVVDWRGERRGLNIPQRKSFARDSSSKQSNGCPPVVDIFLCSTLDGFGRCVFVKRLFDALKVETVNSSKCEVVCSLSAHAVCDKTFMTSDK